MSNLTPEEQQELEQLEAALEELNGRSIELAERIQALRVKGRTQFEVREARMDALIEESGIARECTSIDDWKEEHEGRLPRWALVELDEGPANNGGPWWNVGEDWRELLRNSASQERPDEWPAEALYDLDSDWWTGVTMRVEYEPDADPDMRETFA